jgi:phage terminase Nu1 subunit (DNA packaging protein)
MAQNNNGLLSTLQLGKILRLTDERIRQLAREEIITPVEKNGRGSYFSLNAVGDYCEYLRRYVDKQKNTPLDEQKLQAEVKYKKAKARKAELETAELEGKMHRAEDVEVIYSLLIWSARNMLEALPARTAALITGNKTTAEIQTILEEEIKQSLIELKSVDYTREEFAAQIDKIMRERMGKERTERDEYETENNGEQ